MPHLASVLNCTCGSPRHWLFAVLLVLGIYDTSRDLVKVIGTGIFSQHCTFALALNPYSSLLSFMIGRGYVHTYICSDLQRI